MTKEIPSNQTTRRAILIWTVIPLLLLGLAAAWLYFADPLRSFGGGAPPVRPWRAGLDVRGVPRGGVAPVLEAAVHRVHEVVHRADWVRAVAYAVGDAIEFEPAK